MSNSDVTGVMFIWVMTEMFLYPDLLRSKLSLTGEGGDSKQLLSSQPDWKGSVD